MQSFLRLTLERDDDGTCELFAAASANGFSGNGSAWFNLSEIEDISDLLRKTYPLTNTDCLELKGGYWDKDQRGRLKQLHLGLSFYAVGSRGTVGCHVILATAEDEAARKTSQHNVSLEFLTSYDAIRDFSVELLDLVKGKRSEAILKSVEI